MAVGAKEPAWVAFVAELGRDPGPLDDGPIALGAAIDRACQAWRELSIPREAFAAWLGQRVDRRAAISIDVLHIEDLALAWACVDGQPVAQRTFERLYGALMFEIAGGYGSDAASADEIVQSVREKLLGGGAASPRIAEFGGRAPLLKWLRVIVRRAGIDFARSRGREARGRADADALFENDLRAHDPELDFVKHAYADAFREAFASAVQSLDVRQRNVLRQHAVNGLKVEEIAGMYSVSRRTVTRWITTARAQMLRTLRKTLQDRLRIPDAELTSFLRAVRSRLDVSLSVVLRRSAGAP